jgi:predicted small metal-binding protein
MAYIILSCRETGLDCDYIIKGETREEVLTMGAEHVINAHGMKAEDIVFKNIPCNFLCHILSKINEKQVKDFII